MSGEWIKGIKGSTKAEFFEPVTSLLHSGLGFQKNFVTILGKAKQIVLQHNPDNEGEVDEICNQHHVFIDIHSHSDRMLKYLLTEYSQDITTPILELVELLVRMESTIGVKHLGSFILHKVIEVCQGKVEECVDILLQRKMNQHIPDQRGFYPIHYVSMRLIEEGKLVPVLKSLLDSGANSNVTNKFMSTPLHQLAVGGSEEVVTAVAMLLENEADPNIKDLEDFLPIHYACGREPNGKGGRITEDKLNILFHLVKTGCRVNDRGGEDGLTPLHCCVLSTGLIKEAVRCLFQHKTNPCLPTRQKLQPIHIVCSPRGGVQPSNLDNLIHAAKQKSNIGFDPLHYILRAIVSENKTKEAPSQSTNDVDTELLELLIEHGADVNAKGPYGRTPLHYISFTDGNKIPALKILLKKNANVNATDETIPDEKGANPVHYICGLSEDLVIRPIAEWDEDVIKLMVAHGVDLNAKALGGQLGPLHIATHSAGPHAFECIKSLLNLGAEQDMSDAFGAYPIHYACGLRITGRVLDLPDHTKLPLDLNQVKALEMLVEKSTKLIVNISWLKRFEPLHIILSGKSKEVGEVTKAASLLLEKGAETNQSDEDGQYPLHLACYMISNIYSNKWRQLDSKAEESQMSRTDTLVIRDSQKADTHVVRDWKLGVGELFKMLIKYGADVNQYDKNNKQTPLHIAILLRLPSLVAQVLLEQNADTNVADIFGIQPIHYAFDLTEDMELEQFLNPSYSTRQGTDVSSVFSSAGTDRAVRPRRDSFLSDNPYMELMQSSQTLAAGISSLQIQRQLQSMPYMTQQRALPLIQQNQGAFIQGRSDQEYHVQMTQKSKQQMCDIIELLLAYKSNVNATQVQPVDSTVNIVLDLKGRSVLHLAVLQLNYNPDLIGRLLKAGADPNQQDAYGMSPLHYACKIPSFLVDVLSKNVCKIVQSLLDCVADVNLDDEAFNTPLHYAAACEIPKVIQMLLDGGANMNKRNIRGLKPRDLSLPDSKEREIFDEYTKKKKVPTATLR